VRRRPARTRAAAAAAGAAVLLVAALAVPRPARGGGLYIPGVGGAGLGRAAAHIVAPGDLSAIWYDPAALVDIEGVTLTYENSFVFSHASFDRRDDPTVISDERGVFPPVKNEVHPFYIPMLGLTVATRRNVTLALAFYAPHAGDFAFPADGPQRYAVIKSDTGETFAEAAFGARLSRRVDVGLAAGFSTVFVDETFAVHADPVVANELHSGDATVVLKATAWVVPSLGAALRLHLGGGFAAALSARAPLEVHARGKLEITPSAELQTQVEVAGDAVTMRFPLPLIVNAAVRWDSPGRRFDLELAATWENWSVIDAFVVDATAVRLQSGLVGKSSVGMVRFDKGLRDAFSVRLGAGVTIRKDAVWARAGIGYESPGIRRERLTPSSVDTHKALLGVGVTVRLWRFDLALSYLRIFEAPTDVDDSTYEQLNALSPKRVTIVGNGIYRGSYDVASAALTARF
jgi:long-subunit fatty acid transport protein